MPSKKTVLIVDDRKSALKVISALLEDEGYLVLQAGSGFEALDIFRRYTDLEKAGHGRRVPSDFRPAEARCEYGRAFVRTAGGEELELADPRVRILFPSMGDLSSEGVAASFRGLGLRAEALPPADGEALRSGLSCSTGKECLPLALTSGSLLRTGSDPAVVHLRGGPVLRVAGHSSAHFAGKPAGGVAIDVRSGRMTFQGGGGGSARPTPAGDGSGGSKTSRVIAAAAASDPPRRAAAIAGHNSVFENVIVRWVIRNLPDELPPHNHRLYPAPPAYSTRMVRDGVCYEVAPACRWPAGPAWRVRGRSRAGQSSWRARG